MGEHWNIFRNLQYTTTIDYIFCLIKQWRFLRITES